MKKTILFLLSMSGVAMSAPDVSPIGLELKIAENSAQWVAPSPGTTTVVINSNNATFDASNGTLTTTGTGTFGGLLGTSASYTPLIADINMNTFTLQFDADWTRNASGSSMIASWGEDGNSAWGFDFGISADGNWVVEQRGYNKTADIHTSGVAAVDGGTQTYTIIGHMEQFGEPYWDGAINQIQGKYHVSVYEGDNLVYSASYGGESGSDRLGFGQYYNPYVGFGGGMNNANPTAVTISKAGLYIPEPATATLSLLALAGLAARRRRK